MSDPYVTCSDVYSPRVCDVGDTSSFQHALSEIEDQHLRIDIFINDAGIEQLTPVEEGPSPAYRQIFDVNVFGVMVGTLSVLPGMVFRRQSMAADYAKRIGLAAGTTVSVNVYEVVGIAGLSAIDES
jgi:NADP-dependent 3-hydroxy acid dehydrogenase YdfG